MVKLYKVKIHFLLFLLILFLPTKPLFSGTPYSDFPMFTVLSSPEKETSFQIGKKQQLVDFAVLNDNSGVIALAADETTRPTLIKWNFRDNIETLYLKTEINFIPMEIISHPYSFRLFLLGRSEESGFMILSHDPYINNSTKTIYSDSLPLSNLTTSTARFGGDIRIFFARKRGEKSEILTITENGERLYPVVSDNRELYSKWIIDRVEEQRIDKRNEDTVKPNIIDAPYGVPLEFHPSGGVLLWQNEQRQVMGLPYMYDNWRGDFVPFFSEKIKGKSKFKISPNGLYLMVWEPGRKSLEIYDFNYNKIREVTIEDTNSSKITFTKDGKGIVYCHTNEFSYLPLDLPLYNVENGWMFISKKSEVDLFNTWGGLFRPTDFDQMYYVYESERYAPFREFAAILPIRPVLVTTDSFHEILEAGYAGIFFLNEKYLAIKRFERFIEHGKTLFNDSGTSYWSNLFINASKILNDIYDDEELIQIEKAEGEYGDYKARGYYEQSKEMINYFKAVQYVNKVKLCDKKELDIWLKQKELMDLLRAWINSYRFFVPQSRKRLPGDARTTLSYVKHPDNRVTLFPKAWGIDNEIMDSVVFHSEWPEEDWVIDIHGNPRLLPDINELAYVFGNSLAERILEKKKLFKQYPRLQGILDELRQRWERMRQGDVSNIYNKWMLLISDQVSAKKPDWPWLTDELWETKQILTGLSSWTNIRHATVLINERSAAEGGEGGFFEYITVRPPRGAVEPNPEAFQSLIMVLNGLKGVLELIMLDKDFFDSAEAEKILLFEGIEGIIGQLTGELEKFREIARKEMDQIPLSDDDYRAINSYSSEHDLFTLKSIVSSGYGLPDLDPMTKIVDIYGSQDTGILHSAIGHPLEWNLIVPYHGRRQIVKGPVYSLYELIKNVPVTDSEWRAEIENHSLPEWVRPFIYKSDKDRLKSDTSWYPKESFLFK